MITSAYSHYDNITGIILLNNIVDNDVILHRW